MLDKEQQKGGQNINFNITLWKVKVNFDIINDIRKNFTLVQFMENVVN